VGGKRERRRKVFLPLRKVSPDLSAWFGAEKRRKVLRERRRKEGKRKAAFLTFFWGGRGRGARRKSREEEKKKGSIGKTSVLAGETTSVMASKRKKVGRIILDRTREGGNHFSSPGVAGEIGGGGKLQPARGGGRWGVLREFCLRGRRLKEKGIIFYLGKGEGAKFHGSPQLFGRGKGGRSLFKNQGKLLEF